MDFLGFITFTSHFGNCNFGIPPQSLVFPINDMTLMFLKTPSIGTSPLKLLNERFNCSKKSSLSKPSEMGPERLFCETSKSQRPFKEAIDDGMAPLKEFPCRLRYSKIKQFPIDVGISPDKLLLEISIWLIFFKLPTSNGSLPVNEL